MKRFLSVAGLVMMTACSFSSAPTNTVRLGEYSSLTGPIAAFGTSSHRGFEMAIVERNAAGGVLGKQVELVTEDDQSKSEEARSAILKLVRKHKVVAILGELTSSASIAAAPEAQKAGIPMLSHGATNPKLTEMGDYIFRSCYIDPFQGAADAKFAYDTLGARTAAILTDMKSDYSTGLADVFRKTFTALGGKIVSDEAYTAGDVEFRSQLTKIKGTQPAVIFVPGYYTEVGLIARQARELKMTSQFLGGEGWDSPKVVEIGGVAVDDAYYSSHYSRDDPDPKVQNFIIAYQKKYGDIPDAVAVLAYDAAGLMMDAITRAGSTDGAKIRDALANTKNFSGVTGKITMDAHHNAQKPLVIAQYKNGKPVFKTRVGY